MNFFFDANMNRRYARMLSELCDGRHAVVHITEHPDFIHNNKYSDLNKLIGNNTPDIEWIRKLATSGLDWKIVSGESDIIDTAQERAALLESGLTFFSMDHNWGNAGASEQAWKLVKIWDQIVRCSEATTPTLYRVQMGRVLNIEVIKSGMRARGGRFRT